MQIKKPQLELDMEQQTGFKLEKEDCQSFRLSPYLFSLYVKYFMWNAGLYEAQAGVRLLGEISITSYMQMKPSLWQKVKKK